MLENKNSRMIVKISASGNPHNDEAHQEEIMETYCEKVPDAVTVCVSLQRD
jgi:putative IMPACT (imprinted ancient) family translation regulator